MLCIIPDHLSPAPEMIRNLPIPCFFISISLLDPCQPKAET
ncbi:hypothetical protein RMSM_01927 [Rhodopirellula maiorica SM1]|uniref:Uncharacterized protein n=1 Tax=Rhodopirellula maiorica SM1 TaxID=1265738 RepID=M5RPB5_9BACT|nr:hypothetical protein RMSM_01927 [Rhodopirellula maiorica SM1]